LMFIIFYIYAAVGATFFAKINPELWGDISISLLTLFRVMTFEDWTDYVTLMSSIGLLTACLVTAILLMNALLDELVTHADCRCIKYKICRRNI
jgi:voltage-gated sodium channel